MDRGLTIMSICVVIYTLIAAYTDWRSSKLPNVLTVSALVAALLFHIVYGAVSEGLWGVGVQLLFAVLGFATGFGILFVMWAMGKGGAGDVKYMGALGAWIGAALTFRVFLVVALLVVVGSILILAWQFCASGMGRTKSRYLDLPDAKKKVSEQEIARRKVKRRLMPFGVPAAIATWLVLAVSILTGWNLPTATHHEVAPRDGQQGELDTSGSPETAVSTGIRTRNLS